MSTTEAEALALAVFDEQIVPLAAARRTAGISAFALGPQPDRVSYFEPLSLSSTTLDMAFPGGGTPAGLIDALAGQYRASGDADLAALAPALHGVAAALRDDEAGSGEVDILCYTMF